MNCVVNENVAVAQWNKYTQNYYDIDVLDGYKICS